MAQESIHSEMAQDRTPVVHLVYEVKTDGAIERKVIPFIIGVIGCFSGNSNSSKSINEREFEDINPNDINQIFKVFKPKLNFTIEDMMYKPYNMLNVCLSDDTKKQISQEDILLIENKITNQQYESKEEIQEIVKSSFKDKNDDIVNNYIELFLKNINEIQMDSVPAIEVKMEIESLDDFHPDNIVENVPRLRRLRDIREKLSILVS